MEPRAACALAVHPVTNSIDRPLSRGHAVARTRAFLAGAALEQKKLPPARTAPCALRGPTQSASRPIRTGGWTPVRPLEQAGEPRTRHCGGCGMPRPQLVINAHGWSPRPRRDRPPARANCRRNRRFEPPAAAEVEPGEVPSSELATHAAPAVTAAPAAPRPTSIGRRASLRARCWMLDGLLLEQEGADFGVEAGGLVHVRGMTGVGDDDEAGSVDSIAHLFTAGEGRAGIIGAPDQERRNRYAAECFGEVGMQGARHRAEAHRMEVPHD